MVGLKEEDHRRHREDHHQREHRIEDPRALEQNPRMLLRLDLGALLGGRNCFDGLLSLLGVPVFALP